MVTVNHASSLPTVLLFDIDGTLVLTGGAGRRAMNRAFTDACGHANGLEQVSFAGMTDPGILRAGIEAIGQVPTQALFAAILDAYLRYLAEELPKAEGYVILPGAKETVERAGHHAHVAVGLGTGNVEAGARLKLRHGGLDDYFAFGGFGCDHEDRAEVLRAGAERGAARLGTTRDRCRVVVIGDTPRDVHAARAIDAECIAVGTGGHDLAEMAALGADLVVDDLRRVEAHAAIFRAG